MKIVINKGSMEYDIFSRELRHYLWVTEEEARKLERTDKRLIEAVEKLGEKAYPLEVIEIPDDVDWAVCHDSCGPEFIFDRNRAWGDYDEDEHIHLHLRGSDL